jgi:hypothetical protein
MGYATGDPSYIDSATGVLLDGEAWVAIYSEVAVSDPTSITATSADNGSVADFSQYMDLILILSGQSRYTGGTGCTARVHLNGVETGDKYPTQYFRGDGSSATGTMDMTSDWFDVAEWPSDTDAVAEHGSCVLHLFDINSGKFKTMVSSWAGDRDGSGYSGIATATYLSQAPITSVTFKVRRGGSGLNIATGSTFSLFGILPRMVNA